MKRKYCAALFGIFIGAGLLAGCAKTRESSVVKQKGKSSMENYKEAQDDTAKESSEGASLDTGEGAEDTQEEEGAVQTGALRARLGAPEHYENETTDATGKLKIITDAAVEIPEVDHASMIAVSQHPLDQEQIDLITETFFGDADIYDAYSLMQTTKSEIQAKIEELKGYAAQGNLDPYKWGTDEDGNYMFDINQAIEENEAALADAPEERVWQKVEPQFGLPYGDEGTGWNDTRFDGYVSVEDGSYYHYLLNTYGSFPYDVNIEKVDTLEAASRSENWLEYDMMNNGSLSDLPSKEEMQEEIGISLDEAVTTSQKKVEQLGFTDMELNGWEMAVKYWENVEPESTEDVGYARERQSGAGYILHYTRTLDGIPVTYTNDYGGSLESMDSDMETLAYERLYITVSKDGIEKVEFLNRYDIGEVKTENLELLPFDEIIAIYEKMMQISNADVLNYEKERSYHINRITFGYGRLYEPSADATTGMLVPVWNFFGTFDSAYEGEDGQVDTYTGSKDQYTSQLTINAVDGSVIDLGLGY